MDRPHIKIGAGIVSGCKSGDAGIMSGFLFFITVKTPNLAVAKAMVFIQDGAFASTMSTRSHRKLWPIISDALNIPNIGKGYLLSRPASHPLAADLYILCHKSNTRHASLYL